MGAWGTGLYSDDTTCDVRDCFKQLLASGIGVADAEAAVLSAYGPSLLNHQVECLVYFALAHTQSHLGCLSTTVRDRALALLMSGGDMKHWAPASATDAKKRARVLAKLSVDLLADVKPPQAVPRRAATPLRKQLTAPPGTVFLMSFPNENLAALALVGLRPVGRIAEAVFCVLPWKGLHGSDLPPLKNIASEGVAVDGHK